MKKDRELKKAREAEEDQKFKEQLLAKFAEDERLDQLSEQRRKQKMAEHMKEAERLAQIKRDQARAAEQAERELWEAEQRRQDERRRLIQEERLRLLREHAIKLWGYLPKGTILNEEELAVFPEEMQREYLASKIMGERDRVFDDPVAQRDYDRMFDRDVTAVLSSTPNRPGMRPPPGSPASPATPGGSGLLPGLGGSGTRTPVRPRFKDTRPW
jgi:hypothetical protein